MFGKHGFTSSVAYDPSKDRSKTSAFPKIATQAGTHILIRARVKEDLEDVKRVLPSLIIETDEAADYSFRAVVPRSKMREYAALCVDDIDYDSHFKEATSGAAKGTTYQARHSAVMSVWTAMAKLQPTAPYSGAFTSYWGGGGDYTWSANGGTVKKNGKAVSLSAPKKSSKGSGGIQYGAPDLETYLREYVESEGKQTYRAGSGPRTGFKVGDRVRGYFGVGEVTMVLAGTNDNSDTVTVKPDQKNKSVGKFASNFLVPETLPEIKASEPPPLELTAPSKPPADDDNIDITMEDLYDYLVDRPDLKEFPVRALAALTEDAFELITRLKEQFGEDGKVTTADINEIYSEIEWESASDERRKQWAESGEAVPVKHEAAAIQYVLEDA